MLWYMKCVFATVYLAVIQNAKAEPDGEFFGNVYMNLPTEREPDYDTETFHSPALPRNFVDLDPNPPKNTNNKYKNQDFWEFLNPVEESTKTSFDKATKEYDYLLMDKDNTEENIENDGRTPRNKDSMANVDEYLQNIPEINDEFINKLLQTTESVFDPNMDIYNTEATPSRHNNVYEIRNLLLEHQSHTETTTNDENQEITRTDKYVSHIARNTTDTSTEDSHPQKHWFQKLFADENNNKDVIKNGMSPDNYNIVSAYINDKLSNYLYDKSGNNKPSLNPMFESNHESDINMKRSPKDEVNGEDDYLTRDTKKYPVYRGITETELNVANNINSYKNFAPREAPKVNNNDLSDPRDDDDKKSIHENKSLLTKFLEEGSLRKKNSAVTKRSNSNEENDDELADEIINSVANKPTPDSSSVFYDEFKNNKDDRSDNINNVANIHGETDKPELNVLFTIDTVVDDIVVLKSTSAPEIDSRRFGILKNHKDLEDHENEPQWSVDEIKTKKRIDPSDMEAWKVTESFVATQVTDDQSNQEERSLQTVHNSYIHPTDKSRYSLFEEEDRIDSKNKDLFHINTPSDESETEVGVIEDITRNTTNMEANMSEDIRRLQDDSEPGNIGSWFSSKDLKTKYKTLATVTSSHDKLSEIDPSHDKTLEIEETDTVSVRPKKRFKIVSKNDPRVSSDEEESVKSDPDKLSKKEETSETKLNKVDIYIDKTEKDPSDKKYPDINPIEPNNQTLRKSKPEWEVKKTYKSVLSSTKTTKPYYRQDKLEKKVTTYETSVEDHNNNYAKILRKSHQNHVSSPSEKASKTKAINKVNKEKWPDNNTTNEASDEPMHTTQNTNLHNLYVPDLIIRAKVDGIDDPLENSHGSKYLEYKKSQDNINIEDKLTIKTTNEGEDRITNNRQDERDKKDPILKDIEIWKDKTRPRVKTLKQPKLHLDDIEVWKDTKNNHKTDKTSTENPQKYVSDFENEKDIFKNVDKTIKTSNEGNNQINQASKITEWSTNQTYLDANKSKYVPSKNSGQKEGHGNKTMNDGKKYSDDVSDIEVWDQGSLRHRPKISKNTSVLIEQSTSERNMQEKTTKSTNELSDESKSVYVPHNIKNVKNKKTKVIPSDLLDSDVWQINRTHLDANGKKDYATYSKKTKPDKGASTADKSDSKSDDDELPSELHIENVLRNLADEIKDTVQNKNKQQDHDVNEDNDENDESVSTDSDFADHTDSDFADRLLTTKKPHKHKSHRVHKPHKPYNLADILKKETATQSTTTQTPVTTEEIWYVKRTYVDKAGKKHYITISKKEHDKTPETLNPDKRLRTNLFEQKIWQSNKYKGGLKKKSNKTTSVYDTEGDMFFEDNLPDLQSVGQKIYSKKKPPLRFRKPVSGRYLNYLDNANLSTQEEGDISTTITTTTRKQTTKSKKNTKKITSTTKKVTTKPSSKATTKPLKNKNVSVKKENKIKDTSSTSPLFSTTLPMIPTIGQTSDENAQTSTSEATVIPTHITFKIEHVLTTAKTIFKEGEAHKGHQQNIDKENNIRLTSQSVFSQNNSATTDKYNDFYDYSMDTPDDIQKFIANKVLNKLDAKAPTLLNKNVLSNETYRNETLKLLIDTILDSMLSNKLLKIIGKEKVIKVSTEKFEHPFETTTNRPEEIKYNNTEKFNISSISTTPAENLKRVSVEGRSSTDLRGIGSSAQDSVTHRIVITTPMSSQTTKKEDHSKIFEELFFNKNLNVVPLVNMDQRNFGIDYVITKALVKKIIDILVDRNNVSDSNKTNKIKELLNETTIAHKDLLNSAINTFYNVYKPDIRAQPGIKSPEIPQREPTANRHFNESIYTGTTKMDIIQNIQKTFIEDIQNSFKSNVNKIITKGRSTAFPMTPNDTITPTEEIIVTTPVIDKMITKQTNVVTTERTLQTVVYTTIQELSRLATDTTTKTKETATTQVDNNAIVNEIIREDKRLGIASMNTVDSSLMTDSTTQSQTSYGIVSDILNTSIAMTNTYATPSTEPPFLSSQTTRAKSLLDVIIGPSQDIEQISAFSTKSRDYEYTTTESNANTLITENIEGTMITTEMIYKIEGSEPIQATTETTNKIQDETSKTTSLLPLPIIKNASGMSPMFVNAHNNTYLVIKLPTMATPKPKDRRIIQTEITEILTTVQPTTSQPTYASEATISSSTLTTELPGSSPKLPGGKEMKKKYKNEIPHGYKKYPLGWNSDFSKFPVQNLKEISNNTFEPAKSTVMTSITRTLDNFEMERNTVALLKVEPIKGNTSSRFEPTQAVYRIVQTVTEKLLPMEITGVQPIQNVIIDKESNKASTAPHHIFLPTIEVKVENHLSQDAVRTKFNKAELSMLNVETENTTPMSFKHNKLSKYNSWATHPPAKQHNLTDKSLTDPPTVDLSVLKSRAESIIRNRGMTTPMDLESILKSIVTESNLDNMPVTAATFITPTKSKMSTKIITESTPPTTLSDEMIIAVLRRRMKDKIKYSPKKLQQIFFKTTTKPKVKPNTDLVHVLQKLYSPNDNKSNILYNETSPTSKTYLSTTDIYHPNISALLNSRRMNFNIFGTETEQDKTKSHAESDSDMDTEEDFTVKTIKDKSFLQYRQNFSMFLRNKTFKGYPTVGILMTPQAIDWKVGHVSNLAEKPDTEDVIPISDFQYTVKVPPKGITQLYFDPDRLAVATPPPIEILNVINEIGLIRNSTNIDDIFFTFSTPPIDPRFSSTTESKEISTASTEIQLEFDPEFSTSSEAPFPAIDSNIQVDSLTTTGLPFTPPILDVNLKSIIADNDYLGVEAKIPVDSKSTTETPVTTSHAVLEVNVNKYVTTETATDEPSQVRLQMCRIPPSILDHNVLSINEPTAEPKLMYIKQSSPTTEEDYVAHPEAKVENRRTTPKTTTDSYSTFDDFLFLSTDTTLISTEVTSERKLEPPTDLFPARRPTETTPVDLSLLSESTHTTELFDLPETTTISFIDILLTTNHNVDYNDIASDVALNHTQKSKTETSHIKTTRKHANKPLSTTLLDINFVDTKILPILTRLPTKKTLTLKTSTMKMSPMMSPTTIQITRTRSSTAKTTTAKILRTKSSRIKTPRIITSRIKKLRTKMPTTTTSTVSLVIEQPDIGIPIEATTTETSTTSFIEEKSTKTSYPVLEVLFRAFPNKTFSILPANGMYNYMDMSPKALDSNVESVDSESIKSSRPKGIANKISATTKAASLILVTDTITATIPPLTTTQRIPTVKETNVINKETNVKETTAHNTSIESEITKAYPLLPAYVIPINDTYANVKVLPTNLYNGTIHNQKTMLAIPIPANNTKTNPKVLQSLLTKFENQLDNYLAERVEKESTFSYFLPTTKTVPTATREPDFITEIKKLLLNKILTKKKEYEKKTSHIQELLEKMRRSMESQTTLDKPVAQILPSPKSFALGRDVLETSWKDFFVKYFTTERIPRLTTEKKKKKLVVLEAYPTILRIKERHDKKIENMYKIFPKTTTTEEAKPFFYSETEPSPDEIVDKDDLLDSCGIDNSRSRHLKEGTTKLEKYPWLGSLVYPQGKQRLVTSVVLVHTQLVIASARDIDKLPKKDFRNRAKVVLGCSCTGPRIDVVNYNYHQDFMEGYFALAIVQIALEPVLRMKIRPICPPPHLLSSPRKTKRDLLRHMDIFAMVMPEDCKSSEITLYDMDYVTTDSCQEYYRNQPGTGYTWPKYATCARARRGGVCAWRTGTLLVALDEGRWRLLGFGITGPGCEAPSRYVDYLMYSIWVDGALSRIGQPAITRLGPNQLILRRNQQQIQRFGPCDPEETSGKMFSDSADIAPPVHARGPDHFSVDYNLTFFKNVDYQCVMVYAISIEGSQPKVELQYQCLDPGCQGRRVDDQNNLINVQIVISFQSPFNYKVMAYGRGADLSDPNVISQYPNDYISWPTIPKDNRVFINPRRRTLTRFKSFSGPLNSVSLDNANEQTWRTKNHSFIQSSASVFS